MININRHISPQNAQMNINLGLNQINENIDLDGN